METTKNGIYWVNVVEAPVSVYAVTGENERELVATFDEPGTHSFPAMSSQTEFEGGKVGVITGPFDSTRTLGGKGGAGADKELRGEFEAHAADENIHLSADTQSQLDYLIANYGKVPQTPLPAPSEQEGEGDWSYLADADLSAYVSDAKATKPDGTLPVYGVLLPWYQQSSSSVWSDTECKPELLPAWCNGTPFLFDSLKPDGTPKQWEPSTSLETGVDDYQGEYLWSWWNVNYVRCNNGNRRVTAVQGMDTYATTGEVDVGVMYAQRWFFADAVELTLDDGSKRKYLLIVMAGGPMTDTRFPAAVKERLQSMGVTALTLWKECQRYNDDGSITAAPYGLHAKYDAVLGGNGTTGLKPRSQVGHLLTNVSHNQFVTGVTVTDGATNKKGVTNFSAKGKGYRGGGMDRMLFIALHLMLKGGSKNMQKKMSGQINALKDGVVCQLGSTAAAQVFSPDSASPLLAPGSSVLVTRGAESGFLLYDYVSVGGTGRDFGTTHQARGQIIGFAYHTHPDTQVEYTEIVLELQYGKTSFTYTTSHSITQQIPPTGTTDLVPGHYDGSAYKLTGAHATPCRMMGTEYGIGALGIFLDAVLEYTDGNLLRLWYAGPQVARQTETAFIKANYEDCGTMGKSGNYYAADVVIDLERGTYKQTAPVSGSGSSATGFCDQTTKESATSGMRAYWSFGSVNWLTGAAAGPFGVGVNYYGSYYAYLTNGNWFTAACD